MGVKSLKWTLLALLLAGCGSSAPTPTLVVQSGATTMPDPVHRTEEEWRKILTPEEFYVLRQKGTEAPFVGKYTDTTDAGTYSCAACGQELFTSTTKFHSGCGWPSFYAALAGDRVKLSPDYSLGRVRTEVTCARCGSHLGHVFDDAPDQPTGQRYCINSVAIKFTPAASSTPR